MKSIKEITIVLENCQYFTYKASDFGEFAIGDIHEEISRVASNMIGYTKVANKICIELFIRAQMKKDVITGRPTDSFKRIYDYNDITQFILTYDNGEEETLYINYEDENATDCLGSPNKNQRCMLSRLGCLYIIIDDDLDKTFEDYFDIDAINNLEYMSYREDMCRNC